MFKVLILILILSGFSTMLKSQIQEEIIIVNSQEDLENKLTSLALLARDVQRLIIVVPENNRGWHSFAIWEGEVAYENPNIRLDNKIAELPDVIGKFTSLEFLDISSLGLEKLNPELVNLQKLQTLNVSFNFIDIEKEVTTISKLKSLKTLVAFSCPVSDKAIMQIRDLEQSPQILYTNTDYGREYELWFGWKNKYYEHDSRSKNMIELLEQIHKYFPIGKPYLNYLYPGYEKLQNIQRESATALQNSKKDTWDYLIDQAKLEINERDIVNTSHVAFPARSLMIPLEATKANGIQESKSLHITHSLLTDHYTFYIESQITFKYHVSGGSPFRKRIVYGRQNASESELDLFEKLVEIIKQFYPNYKFVDHHLLMTSKIKGGIPYGEFVESDSLEFSVYSFLFGPYPFGNTEILE